MPDAIGYLRVSTREQGRSGLGLAAQRKEIKSFAQREGFVVRSWWQDIQTGGGADALMLRPGLAAALKKAKAARCPLIVSRLDRLSRNVHFISGLMEHRVQFMVAAFGKVCDNFVLHIYASLAEQERKLIGERIKAATAIRRRRGAKFGFELMSKAKRMRVSAMGWATLSRAANERAEAYRFHLEWALRQPGRRGRPITFNAAADRLNERNIESPKGGRWVGKQVQAMAYRVGIRHPVNRISEQVARAWIQAQWQQNPDITAKQARAKWKFAFPLGIDRASWLLTECRNAASRHSPIQRRVGWKLDCRTVARMKVGAIWRRHPDFTAQQVVEKLGRSRYIKPQWVRRVMNECWRVSAPHTVAQLRHGRRFYFSRRAKHPGRVYGKMKPTPRS